MRDNTRQILAKYLRHSQACGLNEPVDDL
jgi:hypothetical protein